MQRHRQRLQVVAEIGSGETENGVVGRGHEISDGGQIFRPLCYPLWRAEASPQEPRGSPPTDNPVGFSALEFCLPHDRVAPKSADEGASDDG